LNNIDVSDNVTKV